MTVDQMISSFRLYYDRITSFSAPGYEPAEVLTLLNDAQDDIIKDRMFGQNFQPPAFEDNQKRVADLRPLISIAALSYTAVDGYGARQYTIPVTFRYYIKSFATCTRSNHPVIPTPRMFECKFLKSEEIGKVYNSEYNRTHFIRPFVSISGTTAKLIVDRFTTNTDLTMHFIKVPTGLIAGGTCEMPEHIHQEIVDIAVRRGLQIINDPRWQTKTQDNTLDTK